MFPTKLSLAIGYYKQLQQKVEKDMNILSFRMEEAEFQIISGRIIQEGFDVQLLKRTNKFWSTRDMVENTAAILKYVATAGIVYTASYNAFSAGNVIWDGIRMQGINV